MREETTNFYGMLNFGEEFDNGQALSGNVGVRYVKTDITGGGRRWLHRIAALDPTNAASNPRTYLPELAAYLDQADTAINIDNSYEYWLPSMNVKVGTDG